MNRKEGDDFPPVEFHFPDFDRLTKEEKAAVIAEFIKRRNETLRAMGLQIPSGGDKDV